MDDGRVECAVGIFNPPLFSNRPGNVQSGFSWLVKGAVADNRASLCRKCLTRFTFFAIQSLQSVLKYLM